MIAEQEPFFRFFFFPLPLHFWMKWKERERERKEEQERERRKRGSCKKDEVEGRNKIVVRSSRCGSVLSVESVSC